MEENGEAKLLRIFIGESDKVRHLPLYLVTIEKVQVIRYTSGK